MIVRPRVSQAELERIERGAYRIDRWRDALPRGYPAILTPRWYPLVPHPEQVRYEKSRCRFNVVWAGRRSGKTETSKRRVVSIALEAATRGMRSRAFRGFRAIVAGPIRDQAKSIFWPDLKELVPKWAIDRDKGRDGIEESTLTIHLLRGVEIIVIGMDRPQRAAGSPIDYLLLDEFGDMRPNAWKLMRPALSTMGRPGRCDFIGSPVGRNHFYELARDFGVARCDGREWDYFTWSSEDVLDSDEIIAAKSELDPLTYAQQYRAEWANPEGRVCYDFRRDVHCVPLEYDPRSPTLDFCFDFNVSPGTCVVVQDQTSRIPREPFAQTISAVIGEVFIRDNSNTPLVTRKIIEDWNPTDGKIARHSGTVRIFGDSSGGARSTTKETLNSDWSIIRNMLGHVWGDRLEDHVQHSNPLVRQRVNAINARIKNTMGVVSLAIDPHKAPFTVHDLEDIVWKDGAGDAIEKEKNALLGHLFDALSYREWRAHPIGSLGAVTSSSIL